MEDEFEETTTVDPEEMVEPEETSEEGGTEEVPEEPAVDFMELILALQARVDLIDTRIALLTDSISSLVEEGMVIHEDSVETVAEEADPEDDDTLLLEDLDYS